MYKLIINDDEGKTTVVPLIRDEVTIGRKEGNTIRLTDRNVSRFHARVVRHDDEFVIEDLKSLCGTKVNGTQIKADRPPVAVGDQIAIGDYSLSIRTDVATDVPLGKQMEAGDSAAIGKVTPHARLVVLTDPVPGKEIELTADLYVMGRSSEANCQIRDSSISRAHARMDLDAGEWTISDLDSFNGILVNGLKKDDYVLKAGDIIELGNVRIRFVAPGEPFEYAPEEVKPARPSTLPLLDKLKDKPKKMIYLLVGIAAAAVICIVAVVVLAGGEESTDQDPTTNTELLESATFDELLEKGKDAMQQEGWADAATLFALAMRKDPGNKLAREFKDLSVKESDSQNNFNDGIAAEAKEDWTTAYLHFSAIPRSSHYYEESQLVHISGKFCNLILEKIKRAIEKDKSSEARDMFLTIAGIEQAPAECKQESSELEAFLEAMHRDGGVPFEMESEPPPKTKPVRQPAKRPAPRVPPKKDNAPAEPVINPYE